MTRSAATVVLLSVSLAIGCKGNKSTPAPERPLSSATAQGANTTTGYVDDSLCAECHQDLFESFQSVGMAKSFYTADEMEPIEDFENSHYYHPASDRHYEMQSIGGELFQVRYQRDADGNRLHELRIKVDAVIGSGNHVRSYLYRTPSGEMFQMPLAWYSKSRKWRMNPGYDNANHLGFQRKITRDCMFCHNAYPLDIPAGNDAHWQPPTFPQRLPHGIGCQRCHGPGREHIHAAEALDATADRTMSTIVNPGQLTHQLQDDVCMQCHLQPSSQILSEQVRQERSNFSYRPGEPLTSYRAMLDYSSGSVVDFPQTTGGEAEDRFEINHHAYRLRQSVCFLQSEGRLQCTTCHNPHRKVPTELKAKHYRQACIKCHNPTDCDTAADFEQVSPNSTSVTLADCSGCHMPQRRAQDVVHATMTDHRIVALAASEEARLAPRAEPAPVSESAHIHSYFDSSGADGDSLYRLIASIELGDARALRQLAAVAQAQEKPSVLVLSELATGYQKNGDLQSELDTLSRAVQLYPNHVRTNQEMGAALAAAQMHERALQYYRRALAIGPPLPETQLGLGTSMLHRNDIESAVKHLREAVRLRPYYPEALLNLGIALFAIQEFEEAAEFLVRAQAADPTFTEAEMYLKQIPPSAR